MIEWVFIYFKCWTNLTTTYNYLFNQQPKMSKVLCLNQIYGRTLSTNTDQKFKHDQFTIFHNYQKDDRVLPLYFFEIDTIFKKMNDLRGSTGKLLKLLPKRVSSWTVPWDDCTEMYYSNAMMIFTEVITFSRIRQNIFSLSNPAVIVQHWDTIKNNLTSVCYHFTPVFMFIFIQDLN